MTAFSGQQFTMRIPGEIPPGGWCYKHPETGEEFSESVFDELEKRVHVHESANGIKLTPRDHLRQVNLRALVDSHPHLVKMVKVNRRLSQYWSGAWGGFMTIVKFEREGKPVHVSDVLALRRQEVCIRCPMNCDLDEGEFGVMTDKIMKRMSGGKPLVEGLKNCGVCSCPLAAKTYLTAELLRESGDGKEVAAGRYPDGCWIPEELS